jgi:hypothetical protein
MHKVEDDKQPDAADTERKPYQAPRIVESARFEQLVLACLRTMGSSVECNGDPRS